MNRTCRDTRGRITRYLDGELAGAQRAALEAHVAACGECRQELAAVRTLRAALAEVPVPGSEAADRTRILAAAGPLLERHAGRAGRARAGAGWLWPDDLVTAGAVAASVVLAVLLVQGRNAGGPAPGVARSSPVYTVAEHEALEAARSLKADETLHLKGMS
jgi:anti-sigma factor RsiW